jgi:hypothetical protein
MWEHRLVWTSAPPWWAAAWGKGVELLTGQGRRVEQRPDTYFVLLDRSDAGLKLRGGGDDDFDVKVRHDERDGWELWEKCPFFRWDALEALRLAVMLRVPQPPGHVADIVSAPGRAAIDFMTASGLAGRQLTIQKRRVQGSVVDVLPAWTEEARDAEAIAELAEISLPGPAAPLYSVCVEAMAPVDLSPPPGPPARVCGYPQLLRLHLNGSL